MNKRSKSVEAFLVSVLLSGFSGFAGGSETVMPVPEAPFPLEIRVWNPPERDFRIEDFGAQSGQVVTRAVERAVAAANAAGGGRVKVSRGEWLCGAFELLDNVALVLEEGAVLRFPDDPLVITGRPVDARGWPKLKFEGLVFAKDRRNVAILGPGTFKADTGFWERGYHVNPKAGFPRPRFFRLEGCANVRMEDFKVRGSPRWTLHLVNCDDVLLRGVDSVCTGPNTDGLDLDACDRVLVDRCSLDQGDDAYTIKSGRREENRAVVRPCQNVFIRDSVAVHGHTLLGIGSECSGGVRNICMRNCRVTDSVWRFLRVKTNEKRGAFIENVTLEDVTGRRADNQVVEITMFYDGNPVKELTGGSSVAYPTRIKGVTVRNVRCEESPCAVRIEGDARLPPSDVLIENVRVGRLTGKKRLVKISNAPDAVVRDVIEGQ